MTNLNELEKQLKSIPTGEWQELFALIPEMENATSFGEIGGGERVDDQTATTYYWRPSAIADAFFRKTHALGIVPVFDWTRWAEGRTLLADPDTDFGALSALTLCKLLTVIYRTDRFSEGYLGSCFEKGIMLKILKGLEKRVT